MENWSCVLLLTVFFFHFQSLFLWNQLLWCRIFHSSCVVWRAKNTNDKIVQSLRDRIQSQPVEELGRGPEGPVGSSHSLGSSYRDQNILPDSWILLTRSDFILPYYQHRLILPLWHLRFSCFPNILCLAKRAGKWMEVLSFDASTVQNFHILEL